MEDSAPNNTDWLAADGPNFIYTGSFCECNSLEMLYLTALGVIQSQYSNQEFMNKVPDIGPRPYPNCSFEVRVGSGRAAGPQP